MNSSQKFGLFLLIIITVMYVYIAFWGKDFKIPEFNYKNRQESEYSPLNNDIPNKEETVKNKLENKNIKIYIIDKTGNIRAVNRLCKSTEEISCFEYAINSLLSAPSKWEKSKGFTSEIPSGTKLLSVRESANTIMVDLSSDFEAGGGAESTYMRIEQIIKTANANTSLPVYLFINGKQANVVGGEGVMIKQPLNERSLDE